jgi:hypothetical protein
MAQFIPKTPEAIRDTVKRFQDAGVDELLLDPTIADVAQVDMAAEAAFD